MTPRPVAGVDIPVARAILAYNMRRSAKPVLQSDGRPTLIVRYPNGIFFLYFQARLHTSQCEPELANSEPLATRRLPFCDRG